MWPSWYHDGSDWTTLDEFDVDGTAQFEATDDGVYVLVENE